MEAPPFSLKKSFEMSNPYTPIIFILSAGADPLAEIVKFSKEKAKTEDDLPKKSLGKGQEKVAENAILSARQKGQWIILQNCHMCPSFMPALESKVVDTTTYWKEQQNAKNKKGEEGEEQEEFDEDKQVHPDFRFWITTMPDEKFPT